jgi:hypothetical protein
MRGIMKNRSLITHPKWIINAISFSACAIFFTGFAACSAKYGSYQRNKDVYHAFETNQVNPDYKYFANNQHPETVAIVGIDSQYKFESKFWREIEPDTEDFKKSVSRIWEDYGFYRYGANILDPTGNKMGVYYSAVLIRSIKFLEDNKIEIMVHTPFLWGPDDPADIRVP